MFVLLLEIRVQLYLTETTKIQVVTKKMDELLVIFHYISINIIILNFGMGYSHLLPINGN